MFKIITLITSILFAFSIIKGDDNTISNTMLNGESIQVINGLEFPSNGDEPEDAFVAFQFDNPQNDGLPIWGPGDNGVTWIWEYKPLQQSGYYVTFWWSNAAPFGTGYPFLWDGGNSNTYYGCHPYPTGGGSQNTSHYWELAGMDSGSDNINTLSGSPLTVIKDIWYTQAFRVIVNQNGTKTGRFYINLPETSNDKIIEATASAGWGESVPPYPAITFGDSPWFYSYQHERMSGILGRVKIFNKSLSLDDLKKEAADMSALQTEEGRNNIWWGKTSFKSVDDLTCDYGTNRSFHWADTQNKAKLIELQSTPDFESVEFDTTVVGYSNTISFPVYISEDNTTIYTVSMSNGSQYTVSVDGLPIELNADDSIILELEFRPQISGLLRDTVLISNNSSVDPIEVYVSGYAIEPAPPVFELVEFDTTVIGNTNTMSVQIYIQDDNTTIYESSMSNGIHFKVSVDGLPKVFNAGDSVQLNLEFKPQTFGLLKDTVLISNSSQVNPIKVYITGYAVEPVSPEFNIIEFDTVTVGNTSNFSFSIHAFENNLTIDSVKMAIGIHFFSDTDGLPKKLNIGDSVSIKLEFKPLEAGVLFDTLIVSNSTIFNPLKISVKGIAKQATEIRIESSRNLDKFTLFQNFPNPFNPTTTIKYILPETASIMLIIYNTSGQIVKNLMSGRQSAGFHSVVWDGTNDEGLAVSTGIYYCLLKADNYLKSSKMILIR